jgi:hypothetical protein
VAEKPEKYLEYLDWEMTIMGILSTFCVAIVALVLDRVGSAEPVKDTLFSALWAHERTCVLLGSLCVGSAAACFYKQRSRLAWFYGQICLSVDSPKVSQIATEEWLRDADSWATWIPYQSGFTALIIGAVLYSFALIGCDGGALRSRWWLWTAIAVVITVQCCRFAIHNGYKYADNPIQEFLNGLRKRF